MKKRKKNIMLFVPGYNFLTSKKKDGFLNFEMFMTLKKCLQIAEGILINNPDIKYFEVGRKGSRKYWIYTRKEK